MSCLFRSLSYFIENMDENSLRKMIADHLETDPDLFGEGEQTRLSKVVPESEGVSHQEYVRRMRLPSTWGGAIEIKAFCDLFHAVVRVKVLSSGEWIVFEPEQCQPKNFTPLQKTCPMLSISWNGSHYEPLRSNEI